MASTIYFVPATVETTSLRVLREIMDKDTKVASHHVMLLQDMIGKTSSVS
jgi:hypothetical protein